MSKHLRRGDLDSSDRGQGERGTAMWARLVKANGTLAVQVECRRGRTAPSFSPRPPPFSYIFVLIRIVLIFTRKKCNRCRHHKNVTFEYSDMNQLQILNIRKRIRMFKNPFKPDRIQIQSKNIHTIYITTPPWSVEDWKQWNWNLSSVRRPPRFFRVPVDRTSEW